MPWQILLPYHIVVDVKTNELQHPQLTKNYCLQEKLQDITFTDTLPGV